jgi:hypothetical protein
VKVPTDSPFGTNRAQTMPMRATHAHNAAHRRCLVIRTPFAHDVTSRHVEKRTLLGPFGAHRSCALATNSQGWSRPAPSWGVLAEVSVHFETAMRQRASHRHGQSARTTHITSRTSSAIGIPMARITSGKA